MVSEWKEKVIERFDQQAESYSSHNDLQERIANTLAAALPDLGGDADILEIGCGTGTLSQHLFAQYPQARFHITDISPAMVEEAKKNVPANAQISWGVMDGEAPVTDKHYDLIVSNMAFQWFENEHHALKQLQRLLKPTGEMLYSVPSDRSFKEWRSTLHALSLPDGFPQETKWQGVFQEEDIVVDYGKSLMFLQHLKQIGARVPHPDYPMLSSSQLKQACARNDQEYGGITTWNILYGRLMAIRT